MSVLLVTYDLRKPGRSYEPLYAALRKYMHCHGMESIWLLDTVAEPAAVRDQLAALIDANDAIFVVRLHQHWASRGYNCSEWLKDPIRTWD